MKIGSALVRRRHCLAQLQAERLILAVALAVAFAMIVHVQIDLWRCKNVFIQAGISLSINGSKFKHVSSPCEVKSV